MTLAKKINKADMWENIRFPMNVASKRQKQQSPITYLTVSKDHMVMCTLT